MGSWIASWEARLVRVCGWVLTATLTPVLLYGGFVSLILGFPGGLLGVAVIAISVRPWWTGLQVGFDWLRPSEFTTVERVWVWVWVGVALLCLAGAGVAWMAEADSLADILSALPVGATVGTSVISAIGLLTGFRRKAA